MQKLSRALYVLAISVLIGMLTAGYLNLINWLIELIWGHYLVAKSQYNFCYPFLICRPYLLAAALVQRPQRQ